MRTYYVDAPLSIAGNASSRVHRKIDSYVTRQPPFQRIPLPLYIKSVCCSQSLQVELRLRINMMCIAVFSFILFLGSLPNVIDAQSKVCSVIADEKKLLRIVDGDHKPMVAQATFIDNKFNSTGWVLTLMFKETEQSSL